MAEPRVETGITRQPLEPALIRKSLPKIFRCGGYVSFEGLIRDHNHGRRVLRLDYEAYDILAEKELHRIGCEGADRFSLSYVRALHRTGTLYIGDVAVIVQVLANHRGEAFEGCRFIIDQIKSRLPIWKKEYYHDQSSAWTRCRELSL